MNTLSKVFVVLNLVFAVAFCFMTLTLYSKRVDWKDRFEKKKNEHETFREDKEREVTHLNKQKDDLTEALKIAKRDKGELGEKITELEKRLEEEADRFFTVENERRLLQQRDQANKVELQRRYDHIERMHRIILTQQQALEISKKNMRNAINQRMELENELNNAKSRLVATQKEKARLEKDLHHHAWIVQRLIDVGVPVRDLVNISHKQPSVEIHAKVLAVRPEVNLVMLSVGTDEEVQPGFRFTVYRGEKYIGKVEVEKVFSDMASARILTSWTKEAIEEGDNASTGLGAGGGT